MLPQPSSFQLGQNLTICLNWSAQTADFVQGWQQRLYAAEAIGAPAEEHLVEAFSTVLGAVEHLDNYTAQVFLDLYHTIGQLPVPGDQLLVGPLELRVQGRQCEVTRPGGHEQVTITYCLDIKRYRYETCSHVVVPSSQPLLTAQLV